MSGPRKPKCRLGQHTDKPLRGGRRVRCTTCDDVFPCARACEHFDCRLVRGEPLPDWTSIAVEDIAAVVAEALGRSIA